MVIVSTLDANGNSIEDAHQEANGSYSRPRSDGFHTTEEWLLTYRTDKERHEYKFEDHGNWIQRNTLALTKDKGAVATEITYRTINYYE